MRPRTVVGDVAVVEMARAAPDRHAAETTLDGLMNSNPFRLRLVPYALVLCAVSGGLCVLLAILMVSRSGEPLAGFGGLAMAPLAVMTAGVLSIVSHALYKRTRKRSRVTLLLVGIVACSIGGAFYLLLLIS